MPVASRLAVPPLTHQFRPMTRLPIRLAGPAALLALLAATGAARNARATPVGALPTSADKPSLVVLIAIDQFAADYLTRFGPQMNGGIARLMKGGAWFTDAHHDHAITETAPRFCRTAGRRAMCTGIRRTGASSPAAIIARRCPTG